MRSLLQRIAHPELTVGRASAGRELRESILINLRQLLGTSIGSVPSAPDYGVSDIGEALHSGIEGQKIFLLALQRAIERYEPRLKAVRLTYQSPGDDFTIRIEIVGELRVGRERHIAKFSASVEPSRRLTII